MESNNTASLAAVLLNDDTIPEEQGALLTFTSGISSPNAQDVPEPLTILGSLTALGLGALFKQKILNQN